MLVSVLCCSWWGAFERNPGGYWRPCGAWAPTCVLVCILCRQGGGAVAGRCHGWQVTRLWADRVKAPPRSSSSSYCCCQSATSWAWSSTWGCGQQGQVLWLYYQEVWAAVSRLLWVYLLQGHGTADVPGSGCAAGSVHVVCVSPCWLASPWFVCVVCNPTTTHWFQGSLVPVLPWRQR